MLPRTLVRDLKCICGHNRDEHRNPDWQGGRRRAAEESHCLLGRCGCDGYLAENEELNAEVVSARAAWARTFDEGVAHLRRADALQRENDALREQTRLLDQSSEVVTLAEELNRIHDAGNALAEAAHRVSATSDGVHRLRLALAGWYTTLADEFGRKADA